MSFNLINIYNQWSSGFTLDALEHTDTVLFCQDFKIKYIYLHKCYLTSKIFTVNGVQALLWTLLNMLIRSLAKQTQENPTKLGLQFKGPKVV